jgi:hypothetical protein
MKQNATLDANSGGESAGFGAWVLGGVDKCSNHERMAPPMFDIAAVFHRNVQRRDVSSGRFSVL